MSITKETSTQQQWIDWIVTTLREAAWAPSVVMLLYGTAFFMGLYDRHPRLDMPTHFLGGVAITYFFRCAIRNSQKFLGEIPALIQILFAITATGTTAVLWEFGEYTADYYLGSNHMHGLVDTLTDLFMGLSGALLLSLFYRKR